MELYHLFSKDEVLTLEKRKKKFLKLFNTIEMWFVCHHLMPAMELIASAFHEASNVLNWLKKVYKEKSLWTPACRKRKFGKKLALFFLVSLKALSFHLNFFRWLVREIRHLLFHAYHHLFNGLLKKSVSLESLVYTFFLITCLIVILRLVFASIYANIILLNWFIPERNNWFRWGYWQRYPRSFYFNMMKKKPS